MAPSPKAVSIISRWTEGFSAPDPGEWVKLHAADVTYTDHAFQIQASTLAGIADHARVWNRAVPDFKIETDTVWLEERLPQGKTRLVFKTKNTGTFTHDLPRVKASGKSFWFPGVIEFIVRDDDGLIETINEWYTFKFDGVTSVNDYINRPQPKLA
ncbi:hypothetical protein ColLi_03142 [Colletotrichum liriopes]|uniref:SnoaL-like domain-containing protein n=1 Tax=Colletotrichum liriopes TaxID=708192 RepID=A0AA37LPP1_9PEZI|nr:hypothetical protein ColLi_03142 [Colletotrichum liriopes]